MITCLYTIDEISLNSINIFSTTSRGRAILRFTSPISLAFTLSPTSKKTAQNRKVTMDMGMANNGERVFPKKVNISLPDAKPAPITVPIISAVTENTFLILALTRGDYKRNIYRARRQRTSNIRPDC